MRAGECGEGREFGAAAEEGRDPKGEANGVGEASEPRRGPSGEGRGPERRKKELLVTTNATLLHSLKGDLSVVWSVRQSLILLLFRAFRSTAFM